MSTNSNSIEQIKHYLFTKIPTSLLEQAKECSLEYPTLCLITSVAFGVFGIAVFFISPLLFELPFSTISCQIAAGSMTLLSFGAILEVFIQYKHLLKDFPCDMSIPSFKESQCAGGRVFFHESVPIFEFNTEDVFEMGKTHGYLLGENIHEIWYTYIKILTDHCFDETLEIARNFQIPHDYRREIEGLVEGYNLWREEKDRSQGLFLSSQKVTFDQLLVYQMISASHLLSGSNVVSGCATSAYFKDNKVIHGSLLDIPSLSKLGKHTILFKRRNSVVSGFPGMIGGFRGMNDRGLSLSNNVLNSLQEGSGIPAAFLLRKILENCNTIHDVEVYLHQNPSTSSMLFTTATASDVKCFQCIHRGNSYNISSIQSNDQGLFCATNHPLSQRELDLDYATYTDYSSFSRFTRILRKMREEAERNAEHEDLVKASLKSANHYFTVQMITMDPDRKELSICFDNFNAAKEEAQMVKIPQIVLFSR